MKQICYEKMLGLCTRTELFVPGITEKCSLSHQDADESLEEAEEGMRQALFRYESILAEIDKKVVQNSYILDTKSAMYTGQEAIDFLQNEVAGIRTSSDLRRVKKLLKVHGLAIDAIRKGIIDVQAAYAVCSICSFFYRNGCSCEHPLHEKYRKLREITQKARHNGADKRAHRSEA